MWLDNSDYPDLVGDFPDFGQNISSPYQNAPPRFNAMNDAKGLLHGRFLRRLAPETCEHVPVVATPAIHPKMLRRTRDAQLQTYLFRF